MGEREEEGSYTEGMEEETLTKEEGGKGKKKEEDVEVHMTKAGRNKKKLKK